MTSRQPQAPDCADHGERLSNWLALFALLACGIAWTPAASDAPGGEPAGSLARSSAAGSTPTEARHVSRRGAIVTVARVEVMQSFSR